jgi:hypothetical protein
VPYKNKETEAERHKQYYQEHKTERREWQRQYNQAHKADVIERNRQYRQEHQAEMAEGGRQYREAHKAEKAEHDKQYRLQLKLEVLKHYGNGKCACVKCGYDKSIAALSIDHINGNGAEHRRGLGIGSSWSFYGWLKKNNFPEGYQTFCMNCQWIKEIEEGRECRRILQK